LKQATLILSLLGAIFLAGCGGNGDTTSQTDFNNGSGDQPFKPVTHLSHRSVVSNYLAGDLAVMDATQDRLATYTFVTGAGPTYLQPSPDGTLTFVNNKGANSLSSLNNNLEAVKGTITLGGSTQSFVTSTDNSFGFAAVPNYSNGLPPNLPGAINRFNPTDGSLNTAIPFPYVNVLAMDPAQKHLLAFTSGDVATTNGIGTPNGDDNVYLVDLTITDPTTGFPPISVLILPPGSLSKPVAAFFSSDSTKAFILNCGTECGGASPASVTEINGITGGTAQATNYLPSIHQGSAMVVNQWSVSGAHIGLIDLTANKLYVAGSTTTLTDSGGNNVQDGFFTTIDLTAGTASAPIRIGNGGAGIIRNVNGIFWVASGYMGNGGAVTGCGVQSCITMVNPATGTATVLPNANGAATGISLQSNSGEVYTIEGYQLHIYTQSGNPVTSTYNTDIKGQAWDVLYID
jgi:hypothetical protein